MVDEVFERKCKVEEEYVGMLVRFGRMGKLGDGTYYQYPFV